jgi:hypothetical protein
VYSRLEGSSEDVHVVKKNDCSSFQQKSLQRKGHNMIPIISWPFSTALVTTVYLLYNCIEVRCNLEACSIPKYAEVLGPVALCPVMLSGVF